MGHILEVYDKGNCNGFPFASMEINGSIYDFYPNGNGCGIPLWSMIKTRNYTEVYPLPGRNCFPINYFKYVPPGRWGGAYGGVEFYPNGNENGFPEFFFSFCNESAVEFYPKGNSNGFPTVYFEKCGQRVFYYPHGKPLGFPTGTIDKVDDIRDVIELVFYLFIPHGQKYRPNEVIRTDTQSGVFDFGNGNNSSSNSGCGSRNISGSGERNDTASGWMKSGGDSDGDSGTARIDWGNDDDDRPGRPTDCSETVVCCVRRTRNGSIAGGSATSLSGGGRGFDVPEWIEPLFKFIVVIGVLVAGYWALKRFCAFFFE